MSHFYLKLLCLWWLGALPCFSSALELRQQGLELRQQERWSESIEVLERSVALAPQDVTGYIILGWTKHLARRPDAPISLWQALKLNAWAVEAANALGIVYLVKGELEPAILLHSWAALIKPQNEIAHYNLCLAYHRSGLPDWAISHGERAILLEPYNPHPIVAVALVYWSQGAEEQALKLYRAALALDPGYQTETYLDHLAEAGFSPDQITLTNTIRLSLFP